MMRFIEWPWALPLAVLLPIAGAILLVWGRRARARRLAQLGSREVLARLAPRAARRGPAHTIRVVLALACLGLAFAGPRWGRDTAVVSRSGADVVLALDASLSMEATDTRPTRLAKMKEVVRQLRALSPDDRFALIAFAGRSYILTPLTTDDGALDLYLDNLDPSVVGEAGSSMASAIRQATVLLTLGKSDADKAIVLMSDGEAFEPVSDITAEAARAKDAGIDVVTVGFGTVQGSTIPIRENGASTLKKDESGNIVVTKYDPQTLRATAEAGGGVFIPSDAADKASLVRQQIARLKTAAHAVSTGRDLSPRFQWFVVPALLLLLLDAFLALRTRRRGALAAAALGVSLAACGPFDASRMTAMYNRGTELLTHDSLAAAVPMLDTVEVHSAPLRFRSTFNAGWAYLVTGRKIKGDSASRPLDSALAHYHRALVLNPNDMDAKWNYELALRKKKSGGGGGGGGGAGGGGGSSQSPQSQAPQGGGLGQQQAEQLLGSAAREERDVQAKRQKQNRVEPPPGGKDW